MEVEDQQSSEASNNFACPHYKRKCKFVVSLAVHIGNKYERYALYVQEVVTHFICYTYKLLYKIGHYFLDTQ